MDKIFISAYAISYLMATSNSDLAQLLLGSYLYTSSAHEPCHAAVSGFIACKRWSVVILSAEIVLSSPHRPNS